MTNVTNLNISSITGYTDMFSNSDIENIKLGLNNIKTWIENRLTDGGLQLNISVES